MDIVNCLQSIQERDWEEIEEGNLRFAMIGLGWWTREQAIPAIEASQFCETTVVVSGSKERAQDLVREKTSINTALTYEEFIDGASLSEYDAVYICTPNARHLTYARAAAEHNKAILCEKPMEATIERAEELVAVTENVPLMVAYRMQTDPEVRRMRDLISEGAIGKPTTIHGHMGQQVLKDVSKNSDQWRLDPKLAGYGATVMDLGVYPLNTARFVLGADPVSVTAQMHSENESFSDVPDQHAVFTLRFENGTYAACTASQNSNRSGNLRVVGTAGELVLEPTFLGQSSQQFLFRNQENQEVVINDGRQDLFGDEMTEEFDYFADHVLREQAISPNGAHALVDMKTLAAIYQAAKEETTVTI